MLWAIPMVGRGISARKWLIMSRMSREWSNQFADVKWLAMEIALR